MYLSRILKIFSTLTQNKKNKKSVPTNKILVVYMSQLSSFLLLPPSLITCPPIYGTYGQCVYSTYGSNNYGTYGSRNYGTYGPTI